MRRPSLRNSATSRSRLLSAESLESRTLLATLATFDHNPTPYIQSGPDNLQFTSLRSGGALLSEYMPEFKATEWSFPKRNRIMAGMSLATLIIEATPRSGTLVTARLAMEYNRDVLAVPGNIDSETSLGPNMLIKDGAALITTSADILDALGIRREDRELLPPIPTELPEIERQVLELLTLPMHREEILSQLEMSTSEANILLMKMEIAGLISDGQGGIRRA